ncbi:hypothetical protein EC988_005344, partial [Linderina pennispora]
MDAHNDTDSLLIHSLKKESSQLHSSSFMSGAATVAESPVSTRPQTPALFHPSDTPPASSTQKSHPIDFNGFSWP